MAEQIQVEFDLDPVALADLMVAGRRKIVPFVTVGAMVLIGVLAALGGNGFGAFVFFLFAVFSVIVILKMPKQRQSMALRLAGPTKVLFSDAGMDFQSANVAERVPWNRFQVVYDRPERWSFMTKAPSSTFYVPKAAVPPAHLERLTKQLMDWSGSAYKFRKR